MRTLPCLEIIIKYRVYCTRRVMKLLNKLTILNKVNSKDNNKSKYKYYMKANMVIMVYMYNRFTE